MKVLILGSNGLVGSSLIRILSENKTYDEVIPSNRETLDLFKFDNVKDYIGDLQPDVIVNAAAKVGGILANNTYRADFILDNLKINVNLLEALIPFSNIKSHFINSIIYNYFDKSNISSCFLTHTHKFI